MRTHLPVIFVALAFGLANASGCGSVTAQGDGGTGQAGSGSGGSATGAAGTGSGGSGAGGASSGAGGASSAAGHGGAGTSGGTGQAGSSGSGGTGGGNAGHDGGVAGSGGTTGGGGHSGDGGVQSCADLQAQYATALVAARSCDAKATGQCAKLVSGSLSPCFSSCMTYVNDASALSEIKAKWIQAGCNSVPIACPAIACLLPTGNMCVATDGGGGTCVTSSGLPTN
jgi:hypothetical protein